MTTNLTTDGKRLADALITHFVLVEHEGEYESHLMVDASDLNAAAATLFAARDGEGVGLREDELKAAEEAVMAEWAVMREQLRAPHINWPVSPTNWRILRAGWTAIAKARAALASPQPEAKGPVAAGVLEATRILRNAIRSGSLPSCMMPDGAEPCFAFSEQYDAIRAALAALTSTTPPAEAKTPDAATGESVGDGVLREAKLEYCVMNVAAGLRCALECPDTELRDHLQSALDSLNELARTVNAPPAPAGEDETGVRELARLKENCTMCFGRGEKTLCEACDQIAKADEALAPQPPKAETPAGAGEDDGEATYRLGKEEGAADAFLRIAERIGIDGEYRCSPDSELRKGSLVELLERHAAALSTAPAARPGDEVERVDAAMEAIWSKWIVCLNASLPIMDGLTMGDQTAFYEIAQPILRVLAAAPAADGGRG